MDAPGQPFGGDTQRDDAGQGDEKLFGHLLSAPFISGGQAYRVGDRAVKVAELCRSCRLGGRRHLPGWQAASSQGPRLQSFVPWLLTDAGTDADWHAPCPFHSRSLRQTSRGVLRAGDAISRVMQWRVVTGGAQDDEPMDYQPRLSGRTVPP